jgi:hypothetical protein
MADEKVTISALIRLRRSMEVREFALAAFYPQALSGPAAHLKRTKEGKPAGIFASAARPAS